MIDNICRNCNKHFQHEYGQVLCPACLKSIGNAIWKTHMEEIENKLEELDDSDLSRIEEKVQDIRDKRNRILASKKMTKEQLVKLYEGFGIIVPPGSKFYKINGERHGHKGLYGLQVGKYEHSCHIDTTDLLVLLIVDGNTNYVEEYSDLWLSDCITV